jgi:outer membrane protein TolC
LKVAVAALPGLRASVQASRANYAQAEARFGAGLGTSVELADAESVRTAAEIEFALAEFDVARARAALGRAIAEGL